MKKLFCRVLVLALSVISINLVSCSTEKQVSGYIKHPAWTPHVKQALNDFIDSSRDVDSAYVVFDFDNTSAIFDIEEQMMIFQLQQMAFAQTPTELSANLTHGLSNPDLYQEWVCDIVAAYSHLYETYGPFSPNGLAAEKANIIQSDVYWKEFATKMRAMYDFVGENESLEVAYTWPLLWNVGMSSQEIYQLALRSHQYYQSLPTSLQTWTSPKEVSSKLGQVSVEWVSGVTVTENIKELWQVLQSQGIEVWVCSGSGIMQVLAAVDAWGLRDYCSGVLAMTMKEENGKQIADYDFEKGCAYVPNGDQWKPAPYFTHARTGGEGKVTAIKNALMPVYGGQGPLAGFMDSTGDFNFCTEFASLQLVCCFNRADRKVTDGGALIALTAIYQRETLHYDFKKANENSDVFYVLQGRDENGLRTLRPSEKTLRLGKQKEQLFANEQNQILLNYINNKKLSTKDILETFAVYTDEQNADNPLNFPFGFLTDYQGYRSVK